MVVPGVILLIVYIIIYVNKNNKWKEDYAAYKDKQSSVNAQREEILCKAQALV